MITIKLKSKILGRARVVSNKDLKYQLNKKTCDDNEAF